MLPPTYQHFHQQRSRRITFACKMFGNEPPALGGSRFSDSLVASSHDFLLNRHPFQFLAQIHVRRDTTRPVQQAFHIARQHCRRKTIRFMSH
jgi:hypothetical protein